MFFCRSFVVSSTERLPWGTRLWCVSEKFLSRKIYRISWEGLGEGGSITIFVEMFVSRSTERLPWGTLLSCFSEKYPSSKNLWIRWDGGWGGTEYHVFLLKLFFLSLPKKCAVEPFSVSMNLCSEEVFA